METIIKLAVNPCFVPTTIFNFTCVTVLRHDLVIIIPVLEVTEAGLGEVK